MDLLEEILSLHGPDLRHLNLQGWHHVSPFHLIAAKCPNLLHLNLVAIGNARPREVALDFKGSELTACCRDLMALNLSWCAWVEYDHLGRLCELPELRALNLSSCESLSNDELERLLPRLEKLEEIYLRGSKNITIETVTSIIKACPAVELLDITGGYLRFTSGSIEKLEEERPSCLLLPRPEISA